MRLGRPRSVESDRRARELLEHVAAGRSMVEAVELARVSPKRLPKLLDSPEFRQALCRLLDAA